MRALSMRRPLKTGVPMFLVTLVAVLTCPAQAPSSSATSLKGATSRFDELDKGNLNYLRGAARGTGEE
jgi:hypothetical protein